MSQRFAVVYEAEADFQTATELADRVLRDSISWLDENLIGNQREWIGTSPEGCPLKWTSVKNLARETGIKAHGHFDGHPGEPDAAAARRAILYLKAVFSGLNAILLIRDQDNQPERRKGLEQARGETFGPTAIIVGLAVVERESWVVCGFCPKDELEQSRLASEVASLGFDPIHKSHTLTAFKNDRDLRSPKRVLRSLSANDSSRECECWQTTSLAVLRARGTENGLAPFLHEVREKLAPLIGYIVPN